MSRNAYKPVRQILDEWDQGLLGRGELDAALIWTAGALGPDAVLPLLPPDMRECLRVAIFRTYDNDVPDDEFFWINQSPPDLEVSRRALEVLRAWIAEEKRRDPGRIPSTNDETS